MTLTKRKSQLVDSLRKNRSTLFKGLISLAAFTVFAVAEIGIYQIPGFAWASVCLGVIVLELRDLKPNRAEHAKGNPARQIWIIACLAIPVLFIHPWNGTIVITNKYEYLASISSVLLLAFYQAFLSLRSVLFKKLDGIPSALRITLAALLPPIVYISLFLLLIMQQILFDGLLSNEHAVIEALFVALIAFCLPATFIWWKRVKQGALESQQTFRLSLIIIAIFELGLAGISVLLIGDTTLASYTGEHVFDSSAFLSLYTLAAVILSSLVPLKISSYARKPDQGK